jgi:hypothetical protein
VRDHPSVLLHCGFFSLRMSVSCRFVDTLCVVCVCVCVCVCGHGGSDFNDFIAKCLVKDPAKRPSAEELLQHPFILAAKSKALVAAMVDGCMPMIQKFRDDKKAAKLAEEAARAAAEAGEEEEEEEEGGDGAVNSGPVSMSPGTTVLNSGTCIVHPTSGTTVIHQPAWAAPGMREWLVCAISAPLSVSLYGCDVRWRLL